MIEPLPELKAIPQRIISLIPSVTESLFDLGAGSRVVARTDDCIYPKAETARLKSVGSPEDVSLDKVVALYPDLVIAGWHETPKTIIDDLMQRGVPVWLVAPQTVREAVQMLWKMVELLQSELASVKVRLLENSLELAEAVMADLPERRYFCPIRQGVNDNTHWWTIFRHETYPADLLRLFGYINVFSGYDRGSDLADLGKGAAEKPFSRDSCYLQVIREEIIAQDPDVILLPRELCENEPQQIRDTMNIFAPTKAITNRRLILIDGTLLMWGGSRLGQALSFLPSLLLA